MESTSCNFEACQISEDRNGLIESELCSQFQFRLEVSQEQLESTRAQLKYCQSKYQTSQSRLAVARAHVAELPVQRLTDQRQIQQLNQRLAEFERPDSHATDESPKEAVTEGPIPRRPGP